VKEKERNRQVENNQSTPEISTTADSTLPQAVRTLTETEIAQRAYEIYERRGREQGADMEDWLMAERELMLGLTSRRTDVAG
jgi:hypothetical protein